MAKKSNCPPVSKPKMPQSITSGVLKKATNYFNTLADTINAEIAAMGKRKKTTAKASSAKAAATKTKSTATKRKSTRKSASKTLDFGKLQSAICDKYSVLSPRQKGKATRVIRKAYSPATTMTLEASPVSPVSPASPSAKSTGRKLNSTQRKRLETGTWDSFGTPNQRACSSAGRKLKKNNSPSGGRTLVKCKKP